MMHVLAQALAVYAKLCSQVPDDVTCTVAESRHNSRFNRYFNVLPYDFNRVVLPVCTLHTHLFGLHDGKQVAH